MSKTKHDVIRGAVRENYGKIALAAGTGCGEPASATAADISLKLGYSNEEVAGVPAGRAGESARGRRECRGYHFKLRHQPLAR